MKLCESFDALIEFVLPVCLDQPLDQIRGIRIRHPGSLLHCLMPQGKRQMGLPHATENLGRYQLRVDAPLADAGGMGSTIKRVRAALNGENRCKLETNRRKRFHAVEWRLAIFSLHPRQGDRLIGNLQCDIATARQEGLKEV